jgi:hypothetical protein
MRFTDDDKSWITEQLRSVETSLLTEFHKWASPSEAPPNPVRLGRERLIWRATYLAGYATKPGVNVAAA